MYNCLIKQNFIEISEYKRFITRNYRSNKSFYKDRLKIITNIGNLKYILKIFNINIIKYRLFILIYKFLIYEFLKKNQFLNIKKKIYKN